LGEKSDETLVHAKGNLEMEGHYDLLGVRGKRESTKHRRLNEQEVGEKKRRKKLELCSTPLRTGGGGRREGEGESALETSK